MPSKEEILKDQSIIKRSIKSYIERRDFNTALKYIDIYSFFQYLFNLSPDYSDRTQEKFLENIAESCFNSFAIKGDEDIVLFYDYFGFDNRGLTQQYLRALFSKEKRVIYVLESKNPKFHQTDIYKELNIYPYSTIYQLEADSYLGKVEEIIQILKKEKPSKIMMHLAPWDVVAYISFYLVKGLTRYQINLTDHAFWLGVGVTDICLEFREFGANISKKCRKIDTEKIRLLPYYPIINSESEFKGFPEGVKNKKKIFSGSTLYKILGENLIFLDLIKRLLELDDDLVFILAGGGNKTAILNYIKENRLENKFYLIGNRKDISEVIKHSDYYFTTYPFTGGLLSQIAAMSKVPVFSFSTKKYIGNDLKEIFYKMKNPLEEYDTLDLMVNRFKSVYKDKQFLQNYAEDLSNSMITPQEFSDYLQQIFQGENPFQYLERDMKIEGYQDASSEYLIESENKYNPVYYHTLKTRFTEKEREQLFEYYYKRGQVFYSKYRRLKNFIKFVIPERLIKMFKNK